MERRICRLRSRRHVEASDWRKGRMADGSNWHRSCRAREGSGRVRTEYKGKRGKEGGGRRGG